LHYGVGEAAELAIAEYAASPEMDCYNRMMRDMQGVTRDQIKIAFLGSMYGMGGAKFAAALGLPQDAANAIRTAFFDGAPYIRNFAERAGRAAASRGWVRTILGRKRHFELWEPAEYTPDSAALPREKALEKYGEKIRRSGTHRAIQSIVSGSAADTLKVAMLKIWEAGICNTLGAPLITVHDELDFSVPDTPAGAAAIQEARHIMENAIAFRVPLRVDVETGADWGSVK
jgi:DNA polymerase-1